MLPGGLSFPVSSSYRAAFSSWQQRLPGMLPRSSGDLQESLLVDNQVLTDVSEGQIAETAGYSFAALELLS